VKKCVFGSGRYVLIAWLAVTTMAASAVVVARAGTTSTGPACTTQPAGTTRPKPSVHFAAGIESALQGRFDQSAEQFGRVDPSNPDCAAARKALRLVRQYLDYRGRYQAERNAEYVEAVRRVRLSFLTQQCLPQLKKKKLDKKLRKQVKAVTAGFEEADRVDSLDLASADEAAQSKKKAAGAMTKAAAELGKAVKLIGKQKGEYAQAFRALAGQLRVSLTRCRLAWKAVDATTAGGRHAGAMALRTPTNELSDVLAGLEAMVAEKPWRVALGQARLAKELVANGTDVSKEDWYRQVLADAEARGRDAINRAKWYEALQAFLGLQELEEDNESYRRMVKTVRRHVRVLSLYGGGRSASTDDDEPDGDDEPDKDPEKDSDQARWKDFVKGVDVNMVRSAIVQVGENYVLAVDYRKAATGALTSLKILTETPQAGESFPLLRNQEKRKKFLKAIQGEIDNVKQRERVDHLDIQYALNNVIHASERTVEIPIAVVAVEFTEGMLDEMDKFSSMVWPSEVQNFRKQMTGQFFGVGIQITKEVDEPLRVVTPLPSSPAYKAGVKAGDLIVAVNGRPTRKQTLDDLVKSIMGEKGTKVALTVKRPGLREPLDIEIVRDRIQIRTVKGWRREDGGEWGFTIDPAGKIGYIRLTQFTGRTARDFVAALRRMQQAGVRGLVLDMRFNPGGMLASAIAVADEFLRRGIIVSTKGRNVRRRPARAGQDGGYLDGDLVVLVNQASASAAEIVSGALKDWRRGIIVGHRTYGKGSVQNVIPIRRQRAFLKLTTSYYYLPSGRLLHRKNGAKDWGVDPDVEVVITPKQMRRWLGIRRKTDLIKEIDPKILQGDLTAQLDADLQLNTAVLLLKLMQLKEAKPAA